VAEKEQMMSQIATGYGVSSSLLDRLLPILEDRNYTAFWFLLKEEAVETTPAYAFSGSVMSIALAYLENKGVALPLNDSPATTQATLSSDLSLVLGCDAQQVGIPLDDAGQWFMGAQAASLG
jgi:hypothetical protein